MAKRYADALYEEHWAEIDQIPPADIKAAAEAIFDDVGVRNVKLVDIANLIAKHLDRGNGSGRFYAPESARCKEIIAEAKVSGIVHICGEMEFPLTASAAEAFACMSKIASACGYIVGWRGRSAITVTGGDIPGEFTFQWNSQTSAPFIRMALEREVSVGYTA